MRMRKKSNLEPRLSACAELLLARGKPCANLKEAAETYRALLDYDAVFGNNHPVELEVGCGNGGFILELARRNPQTNYIAVELCSNVIITAIERVKAEGLKNVRFLNIAAEILPCYIPEQSIQKLYLNFSTPLPESSREKQRLTATRFLKIYHTLLTKGGEIAQKTDSEQFFDYSLLQYENNGFTVKKVTRDLNGSEWAKNNIVTEYEANFIAQGKKIFACIAQKID